MATRKHRMFISSIARRKRKDTKELRDKLTKREFSYLRHLREKNKKIEARHHT
jgi:transposase